MSRPRWRQCRSPGCPPGPSGRVASALRARAVRPDLPLVLRIFDDDLAEQAQRDLGTATSLSMARLAAPAFAAALAGQQVTATILVGRGILLVGDMLVGADSGLAGSPIGEHLDPQQTRVLALRPHGHDTLIWAPPADRTLTPGDQVLILATAPACDRGPGIAAGQRPQDPGTHNGE